MAEKNTLGTGETKKGDIIEGEGEVKAVSYPMGEVLDKDVINYWKEYGICNNLKDTWDAVASKRLIQGLLFEEIRAFSEERANRKRLEIDGQSITDLHKRMVDDLKPFCGTDFHTSARKLVTNLVSTHPYDTRINFIAERLEVHEALSKLVLDKAFVSLWRRLKFTAISSTDERQWLFREVCRRVASICRSDQALSWVQRHYLNLVMICFREEHIAKLAEVPNTMLLRKYSVMKLTYESNPMDFRRRVSAC